MKNIKRIFVLCTMMITLASCSKQNDECISNNTSSPTDVVATNITTANPTEEPTKLPTQELKENDKKYDDTLDGIEKYLSDEGLLSGDRIKKEASMIGGIDGFAYKESDIEIYEYDVDSEEYKTLSNGEAIPIKGMENYSITADAINGKFVLLSDNEKVIKTFNKFNN